MTDSISFSVRGPLEFAGRDPLPVVGTPGSGTARPPLGRAGDVVLDGSADTAIIIDDDPSTRPAGILDATVEFTAATFVPTDSLVSLIGSDSAVTGGGRSWQLSVNSSGLLQLRVSLDGDTITTVEGPTIPLTTRTIRVRRDPADGQIRWWVDGVEGTASSGPSGALWAGEAGHSIGAQRPAVIVNRLAGVIRSATVDYDGGRAITFANGTTEEDLTVTLSGDARQLTADAVSYFGAQYITVGEANDTAFTLLLDVHQADATNARIAGNRLHTGDNTGWDVTTSGAITLDSGAATTSSPSAGLAAGQSATLAYVVTDDTFRVWIDGTELASSSTPAGWDAADLSATVLTLGARQPGKLMWLGGDIRGAAWAPGDLGADVVAAWTAAGASSTVVRDAVRAAGGWVIDWSDTPTATVYDEADQVLDVARRTDPLFPSAPTGRASLELIGGTT